MNNAQLNTKKLVVLSGAGISAESGIKTFRDMGGLWETFDVMEVASINGWHANKKLVLQFYNDRRAQLAHCEPNEGHTILTELERNFDVHVITQNVDNLHERAGSSKILHLHGELTKVRSTYDAEDIYDIGYKAIQTGDTCDNGHQLRPHIVWFGEAVPNMTEAIQTIQDADIFLIIGTSLSVYPAAGLLHYAPASCKTYLIDPHIIEHIPKSITTIQENASSGMKTFRKMLKKK
ncbi:MAG: NAD-dependent deacylase [Bacteroidales bacterium]|jgi:NAD-dependent deacetylase|nr:NAD-dependent deacylase [Bacteroidales bacterium]